MSAEETAKVNLWCHVCRRFVEHHAAYVDARRGSARVLYVTPAVLAKHRATHETPGEAS
ncbi:MAG: hypothetical protein K0S43_391 [Cellulosimicrobium sp.]|nr:hypothetical protein [Cellulosimicrobium sp.]